MDAPRLPRHPALKGARLFDRIGKVIPVLKEVAELIDAIADMADDGASPEETARFVAALKALAARVRLKK